MPSSRMLRHVAPVKTDVSEEINASIIRATRIGELGTMLAVTSNRCTLRRSGQLLPSFHSLRRLLVTANVVPILPILVTHPDDGGTAFLRNVGSY
jgi:hypothetical protein